MAQHFNRRLPLTIRGRARAIGMRLGIALALGAAVFTVQSCSSDSGGVTTPDPVISRIDVTAPLTTLSPGQTVQLSAVAKTAAGAVVAGTPTWSSSSTEKATVNGSGVVTAVAPGAVTITATRGGISGTTALTVIAAGGAVATVSVALSDVTLQIGDLAQATVSARDANNAVIALGNRPLTWSSTNIAVATISSAGVITTAGIGTTQIRASVVEGTTTVIGNATLTIVANPDAKASVDVSMPGLTYSPADIVLKVNGTVRFIFPSMDHNVVFSPRIAGSPADIEIRSNQTVSRTFTTVGVFPYVCTLHNGMVGTVVVSP
ncbi:MAG: Ig-like domain-containing protein [Gemmatimonas sp.]